MDDFADGRNALVDVAEVWKPVYGFEDTYYISSIGRLRRICPYCGPEHFKMLSNKERSRQGYVQYQLRRCKKRLRTFGHVFVAEAFFGPRPPGMWINHKNGIKADNRVENLEYVTPSQNHIHAVMNGLRPAIKLDADKVRQIRSLQGVASSPALAARFGVTKTTILCIWKRTTWTHLD